jgi:hypothetical protein
VGEGTDETERHEDRDGAGGVVGGGEFELDVDGDEGVGAVVDVAGERFCSDGNVAVCGVFGGGDLPVDFGCVFWDAAVDLAIEELDDFGAALVPPDFWRGDFFAVIQKERVGEIGDGIGFGLVVVGGVGRVGVAGAAGAEGGDLEEIHGSLMVLLVGEVDGLLRDGFDACVQSED